MKNKLFYTNKFKDLESRILTLLNSQKPETLGIMKTARETGDRVGTFISEHFNAILEKDGSDIKIDNAYKKLSNVSFKDEDGFTYFVDVITHNLKVKFSRPNITSVDRLNKIYKNDKNIFVILLVHFDPTSEKKFIESVNLIPIEFISWDCLDFGLLGKGQIQIRKSSNVIMKYKYSRKKWMLDFSKKLNRFYVGAADKIVGQLKLAIEIEDTWINKPDTWK